MFYNKILQENKDSHTKVAFVTQKDRSRNYNFAEYFHVVETIAKAFLKMGLKLDDSACIVATNRPEWFFSHFGAIEVILISWKMLPQFNMKLV